MTPFKTSLALVGLAGLLAGCSSVSASRLLGGDEPAAQPQAYAAPDLSMPPDLQLNPPGTAAAPAAPQPQSTQVATAPARPAPAPGAAPQGDVYEQNGISKVHADGTPKTDAELKAELRKIYIARKQQGNPNYGTVFNIGNIFKDE